MWYLTSEDDRRVLYVFPTKQVVIGRIEGDDKFSIYDDTSISRNHAILYITENNLYIKDTESRYGTYINNSSTQISSNMPIKLNTNDIVRFGKLNCIWKVNFINFVSCASTLKGESLLAVKKSIEKLDGILKNEWDSSCNFLTMPTITLTIKVVLALVQGSNIVNVDFWNKCVEAVIKNNILPDPNDYLPSVAESTLNKEKVSFQPDARRKTMFAGKNFVFFSKKHWEMYRNVLVNSSATALLLSETKMTKSRLADDDIILIQYNINNHNQETQAQRNQINDIVNYLKAKGKRVVADAEIGLAILYCSIDKYCNPDFNFTTEVIKKTDEQNIQKGNVLAHETQESDLQQPPSKQITVDESLMSKTISSLDSTHSSKRKHIDDEELDARKKIALGNMLEEKIECGKRKLNDELDTPPIKKIATHSNGLESEDCFYFKDNDTTINTSEKKLNFTKPFKSTKIQSEQDENLFDFVEGISKTSSDKTGTIFERSVMENNEKNKNNPSLINENTQDISAMRGIKLKELMDNNPDFIPKNNVKKEPIDELNTKMDELDLGCVVLKIRNDLVIKKEPPECDAHSSFKNFKKFKKVWPIKTQTTVIPKSSMSIVVSDEA